ncbi:hypothetical protein CRENBAI_012879, partial [Crenichthys baileyi]
PSSFPMSHVTNLCRPRLPSLPGDRSHPHRAELHAQKQEHSSSLREEDGKQEIERGVAASA